MSRISARAATVLLLAFAGGGGAAAQTDPAGVGAAPARVEQHIKRMHDQLGITPAEQAQWDQFAAVMRDNARSMEQAASERGSRLGSMNAADDLNSYAQLAQAHAADVQRLAAAFQTLYATFPDQQKAVADAVFHKQAEAHDRKRRGS